MEQPFAVDASSHSVGGPPMNYNDHAFIDFDMAEQMHSYNDNFAAMNNASDNTPILQDEASPGFLPPQQQRQQQQGMATNPSHSFNLDDVGDDDYYYLYGQDDDDDAPHEEEEENDPDSLLYVPPPRPLSGLFLKHNSRRARQALRLQHRQPQSTMPPALPAMMAQAWKGLSPSARAHYEGLAAREQQERFQKQQQQQQQQQQQSPSIRNTTMPSCSSSSLVGTPPIHPNNQDSTTIDLTMSPDGNDHVTNHHNKLMLLVQPPQPNNPVVDLAFMTPSYKRAIADLAGKLDTASIDFLIRAFK